MNWLSKWQLRRPKRTYCVAPNPPRPFPRGYTIPEFRQNAAMVLSMHKLLHEDALGGHILSALYNGIPAGYPARGDAVNETMAAIELGRQQGYMDCLIALQSLAEEIKVATEIEQTYGAEQFKEEMGIPDEKSD